MAEIELTRLRSGWGAMLSYKVILDGECIGSINNGITKTFNIASGPHQLRIEVDADQSFPLSSPLDPAKLRNLDVPISHYKIYSNTLDVYLGDGKTQKYEVRNSGGIRGFVEGVFTKSSQGMTLRRL